MAAFSARVFLVLTLALTSQAALGGEDELLLTNAVTTLAETELRKAEAYLSETIDACDKKMLVIKIPLSAEIGVSRRALLLGCDYFYRRNRNACLAPAMQQYVLAKLTYLKSLPVRTVSEVTDETPSSIDTIADEWWRELRAKARYHAEVPEGERAKIERIPGLVQPFDMIHSWAASGN